MGRSAALVPIVLALTAVIAASAASPRKPGPISLTHCQSLDQSGSYVLANNLNAAGDCLVITAQGVTIDLGGFAIIGDGTGTAIKGVRAHTGGIPQARTVVRNGDISNFAQATNLSGTVSGLRVTSNGEGIVVSVGSVTGNTVQFNRSVGISLADGIVAGNLVIANGTGITVAEAGVVSGNQVAGNKIGVDVAGTGSTLIGNIIDGNSEIGLRVGCPSNLANNTAIGNGENLVMNGPGCLSTDNLAP